MRSTDGNTDVVDCCVSTMVLPLFYSSGAVVYRKPVLSVAHHLHNLFYTLQFQSNTDLNTEQIARFAHAGAEALQMQTRLDTWLDSATSAALLHLTADELRALVASDVLPAT